MSLFDWMDFIDHSIFFGGNGAFIENCKDNWFLAIVLSRFSKLDSLCEKRNIT